MLCSIEYMIRCSLIDVNSHQYANYYRKVGIILLSLCASHSACRRYLRSRRSVHRHWTNPALSSCIASARIPDSRVQKFTVIASMRYRQPLPKRGKGSAMEKNQILLKILHVRLALPSTIWKPFLIKIVIQSADSQFPYQEKYLSDNARKYLIKGISLLILLGFPLPQDITIWRLTRVQDTQWEWKPKPSTRRCRSKAKTKILGQAAMKTQKQWVLVASIQFRSIGVLEQPYSIQKDQHDSSSSVHFEIC